MSVTRSLRCIGLAAATLAGSVALARTGATGVTGPAGADAASRSRPITMVVPQAPGGGVDLLARLVMHRMASALGQPLVIENRAGARGLIGTRYVARAASDGYTLLLTSPSHNINAVLHQKAGYDALGDFTPVALLARGPFVLVAHPDFEAKSTAELIALARKNPGGIAYGSVGAGSFNHLLGEMFNAAAQVKLQHVPYKGSAQAASAVVGGQIPLSFNSLPRPPPFLPPRRLPPPRPPPPPPRRQGGPPVAGPPAPGGPATAHRRQALGPDRAPAARARDGAVDGAVSRAHHLRQPARFWRPAGRAAHPLAPGDRGRQRHARRLNAPGLNAPALTGASRSPCDAARLAPMALPCARQRREKPV